jgi:alkylhydroperoxidase family enzyme
LQDPNDDLVNAIAEANREDAPVPQSEKDLLWYAEKLTLHPADMTAEDAQKLRNVGWDDPQIDEAVYIISLFAFFNRVADAFGLLDPEYRKRILPQS